MFEKILNFLGISYDIAENVRKTDTDVKDNKDGLRRYEFHDGDSSNPPTSRKEYKKSKTNKKTSKEERDCR